MTTARIAGVIAGGVLALSAFALASSADVVTLTPEQTLALFGDQLGGVVYPVRNGSAVGITFDYAFPLKSIGYMDSGGGFDPSQVYGATGGGNAAREEMRDYLGDRNGLVYIASSSQWGGVDITPYTEYGGVPVQLHAAFSVRLSGIGGYQQSILYPSLHQTISTNNPRRDASYMTFAGDSYNPVQGNTIGGVDVAANYSLPTYPYYSQIYDPETGTSQSAAVDQSQLQWFIPFYVNTEEQPASFDVNGITIDCYGVTNSSSGGTDLWLIVTCPTIWDYTPSVTTSVPVTSFTGETGVTGIGTTQTGVDMSQISVDLREIIYNQRWQIHQNEILNENARIIANNTNTIVQQLNKIYEQMVKTGDVPVSTDTPIAAAIGSAINGYTTARLPDEAVNGISFWSHLSQWLMSEYGFCNTVALFALCMGVTCWIIFRGRTS